MSDKTETITLFMVFSVVRVESVNKPEFATLFLHIRPHLALDQPVRVVNVAGVWIRPQDVMSSQLTLTF